MLSIMGLVVPSPQHCVCVWEHVYVPAVHVCALCIQRLEVNLGCLPLLLSVV